MNIFLGGAAYNRDWRLEITPAYTQSFVQIPATSEYPFEYLWKSWIKGGKGGILEGEHNYVGPFKIGDDVPKAYLPKEFTGLKAYFHSLKSADLAYFYLEPYDGETRYRDDVLTQIGYAIAQKDIRPYHIIINTTEQVELGWIPTQFVDVVVDIYNPLVGLTEGISLL